VSSQFRNDVYTCLTRRADALVELADALLCEPGPVRSPVDLTLSPEYRRGHGALYGGLNHGRINVEQLRQVPPGLPLPRWPDGRIVLAVDVSPWLRSDTRQLGRAVVLSRVRPDQERLAVHPGPAVLVRGGVGDGPHQGLRGSRAADAVAQVRDVLCEFLDLRRGEPADRVEFDVLGRQVVEQPASLPEQDRYDV
jgi:hypothetical protein